MNFERRCTFLRYYFLEVNVKFPRLFATKNFVLEQANFATSFGGDRSRVSFRTPVLPIVLNDNDIVQISL